MLEGLDVLIIRGHKKDVQQVMNVIKRSRPSAVKPNRPSKSTSLNLSIARPSSI